MSPLQLINLELLALGYATSYGTLDLSAFGSGHCERIVIANNDHPSQPLTITIWRADPVTVEIGTTARGGRHYDLNKPTSIESILTRVRTTLPNP